VVILLRYIVVAIITDRCCSLANVFKTYFASP